MGLIKETFGNMKDSAGNIAESGGGALSGAFGGILHQAAYQEYFVSGDMTGDILMKRAEQVRTNGSKNNNSDANVISDGSLIDVQENQCVIIVENGKVVEACMEPGRFIYNTKMAPSFFAGQGKFSERFVAAAKEMFEQMKLGGMRRNTQRLYYINMGILDKSLMWGVGNVSFKHTQRFEGLPAPLVMTVHVKGHGTARVRIERPLDFYAMYGAKYAGGDNNGCVSLDSLDTFFENSRQKMSQAVSIAMAELGNSAEVPYDAIMVGDNVKRLAALADQQLEGTDLYKIGFSCYDFTVGGSGLTISDEDAAVIAQRQNQMMMMANGAAGYDIQTQYAQGFNKGAENGGMDGMMGMGVLMGGPMGGMFQNGAGLNQPAYNPAYANNRQTVPQPASQAPQPPVQPQVVVGAAMNQANVQTPDADSWTCECGKVVVGNFCPNCGKKKPAPKKVETNLDSEWVCTCGATNTGNFCSKCGKKRPAGKTKWVCDKCGWKGELDGATFFCPNCGDPIDGADIKD